MDRKHLSNEEVANFCLELSYLIHAGIRTSQALQLIADDAKGSGREELFENMAFEMDEGRNLSDVVKGSGVFPDYAGKFITVGEESGRLEEALESLADTFEHRAALDRRINSALLYPSVLLLVMLAVVAVLLVYVLPIFNDVYAQLGGKLTGIAALLLGAGKMLKTVLPLLAVVFAALVALLLLFSSSAGFRSKLIGGWQKRFGDKGVAGKIGSARFAQALSLGINSGMPVEDALEVSTELLADSPSLCRKAENVRERMAEGQTLSAALGDSGIFPKAQCRILEAGIRGGASEKAMKQIASTMTDDSESSIEELVAKVEPTMVIVTSVLVALILLSVMMPLINIMSAIG